MLLPFAVFARMCLILPKRRKQCVEAKKRAGNFPARGFSFLRLKGDFFLKKRAQLVAMQPDLLHRIAVADGDGAVFDGIKVHRDAIGRADFVLAAVALADRAVSS